MSRIRSSRILALVLAICLGRAFAAADAVDPANSELVPDGGADGGFEYEPVPAAPPQTSIVHEIFESYLFGATGSNVVVAAQRRLDLTAAEKVESLDAVCRLTETQRAKLRLAGRGDIKRFFDRVDAAQRSLPIVPDDQIDDAVRNAIRQETNPLRARLEAGPFGEGSLFAKTINLTLTSEQRDRRRTIETIERLGGRVEPVKGSRPPALNVMFAGVGLTDEELGKLALENLESLNGLFLSSTKVTDRGLKHIQNLRQLKMLQLSSMEITDGGLANLGDLTELRILALTHVPVTGAGLSHLLGLTNLQHLSIPASAAGDELDRLKELPQMKSLYLHMEPRDGSGGQRNIIRVKLPNRPLP